MTENTIDTQNIQDYARDDILKHIFGDIGELIEDFSCAVESTVLLHGRMYITDRFICFYSNIFGLEKKIRIPYNHIKSLTKENTAMVIPNAIAVSTGKKDYVFRSFWDRDECFRLLEGYLHKYTKNNTKTNSFRSVGVDAGKTLTDKTKKTSFVGSNAEEETLVDTESGFHKDNTTTEGEVLVYSERLEQLRRKIPVVSDDTIPISLIEFRQKFIDEDAPYGFKQYHEMVKDTNIEITKWMKLSDTLGETREMKFFKPVNLPGLASTRGMKVQRMIDFGEEGFILCSSTSLEDVPAADSFTVEDTIAVKAVSSEMVSVDISFEVKFIKSTYFKYVIEKSTNTEMLKWLAAYFAHVKSVGPQSNMVALHDTTLHQEDAHSDVDEQETMAIKQLEEDSFLSAVISPKSFIILILIGFIVVSSLDQWQISVLQHQLLDMEKIINDLKDKIHET